MTDRIAALEARYPELVAVRHAGLMIGIEIRGCDRSDRAATGRIVNGMRDSGDSDRLMPARATTR